MAGNALWVDVHVKTISMDAIVTKVRVDKKANLPSSIYLVKLLHLHEIVEGLHFPSSLSVVCLFVCLCVCLCVRISCEQNSSRTDAPIWIQFSLNGCLQPWLGPY